MSNRTILLCVALLWVVRTAGLAESREPTVTTGRDDKVAAASPPSDPFEGSVRAVSQVAEGSVSAVTGAADGAIKAVAGAVGEMGTIFERDILAGPGRFINRESLNVSGLTFSLAGTIVYQQNTRGGLSTHNRAGRFTGVYDIQMAADFERLLGLEGAGFYMLGEGAWSKNGGIDGPSVGSSFGANSAAGTGIRRSMDVLEAWFEGSMFDGDIRLRFGKIHIGGGFECGGRPVSFDGNMYANDGTTQFLNGGLVNNPTIPIPDRGLGAVVMYNPVEWWYGSFGIADAQADARETGFNTAFTEEDFFLYIFETGVTPRLDSKNGPLQGAYRVGLWVDGQDKARFSNGGNYRDDMGVYVSCDQMLVKENNDAEDTQGLGGFFRWGYANSDLNTIGNFWSLGFQYQGLLDGRHEDLTGVGIAQGIFSDHVGSGQTDDSETVVEIYYNAAVNEWLSLSPSLQYITDPGGADGGKDAVVLGLRAQMTF